MNIRLRDGAFTRWKLRGRHFLTAITAIGLLAWVPGCGIPRETGPHDAGVSVPENLRIEYPVRLVGPLADWRPQDYSDSRGITSVRFDPAAKCLTLNFELITGHEHASSGEIVLDLKYVPTLEGEVPVDMTDRQIAVDLEVPDALIASGPANGCQVFVKDDQFRSQYGGWHNCTQRGLVQIRLQPSTVAPPDGFTEPGFDPRRVRTIGVKCGTNDWSRHGVRFAGQARIKSIVVTPDLPWGQPPLRSVDAPMPRLRTDHTWEFRPDGFYVDGKKTFLAGGNWRGIEYGQNFGTTRWFPGGNGFSRYPGFVAARLDTFRRAGISVLRVGLLDDGRAVLDREGRVTGMNDVFQADVQTLLDLAARLDVKIELVLFDYLVGGYGQEVDGVWVRGRSGVIEDEQRRARFLDDFLEPFLDRFGDHPALFGFDVINEPEWIVAEVDGGGWETVQDETPEQQRYKAVRPVPGRALSDFIRACVERIRRKAPGKPVTVGISCKYLAMVDGLDLDYFAPHYYPWMGDLDEILATIPDDKPWMLEEFPGKGDLTAYLDAARRRGAAGALVWNLSPGIDDQCYSFDEEAAKLQEIRQAVSQLP